MKLKHYEFIKAKKKKKKIQTMLSGRQHVMCDDQENPEYY